MMPSRMQLVRSDAPFSDMIHTFKASADVALHSRTMADCWVVFACEVNNRNTRPAGLEESRMVPQIETPSSVGRPRF